MIKARNRNTETRNLKKKENTRRAHTDKTKLYWKQEYLDRKHDNGEDTRE